MPDQFRSAKEELRRRHQRANWSRRLLRPIPLASGADLKTLNDAALRILELPPTPSSRLAAKRIIDAALGEGDMIATEIAVRLALGSSLRSKSDADLLKALYASVTEPVPELKQ